jgi:hypothetical protein
VKFGLMSAMVSYNIDLPFDVEDLRCHLIGYVLKLVGMPPDFPRHSLVICTLSYSSSGQVEAISEEN